MKPIKSDSQTNIVVRFFSSVKLAITLLMLLALTSIIGTVLPQGESLRFYLEKFGPTWFKIIKGLKLYDTYHSWWYLTLLGLFSVNLIVCTIRRFPFTMRLFKKDNLHLQPEELKRRPYKRVWPLGKGSDLDQAGSRIEALIKKIGRAQSADSGEGKVYLVEKGKWSYWGVYAIHLSILVIFLGAVYGSFTGFKGRLNLIEGESADRVALVSTDSEGREVPLGFTVKCEKFVVEFYDTGAPKLFQSDLVILDGGREVLRKSIEVNDPLTYKGITFYQSSYQSLPQAKVAITTPSGTRDELSISAFSRTLWPETGLVMALIRYLPNVHGMPAVRVYIGDDRGNGDAVWLFQGHEKEYKIGQKVFKLALETVSEKYMTGLQVKKDPGVAIVWLGCALMIAGFAVVFWVPHKRIWLWVGRNSGRPTVILAGQTSKNRIGFEKEFDRIAEELEKELGVK